MGQRRPLVAGNWKMNGLLADGPERARALQGLVEEHDNPKAEIVVCPPATLLAPLAEILRGGDIGLGAQDCHPAEAGAYTGDISAAMLAELGCSHVILGHSERRRDHGETSAQVAEKVGAAQSRDLTAIVCLGETLEERDAGRTLAVVETQLADSLPAGADAGRLVVAYEPVWAIGTGRTATTEQVAEVHDHLRGLLAARGAAFDAVRLLYGGSVNSVNAQSLMTVETVDGALVGGASLKVEEFWAIIGSCP
jgi:triosephosphate isomerase (TIM)